MVGRYSRNRAHEHKHQVCHTDNTAGEEFFKPKDSTRTGFNDIHKALGVLVIDREDVYRFEEATPSQVQEM